jgi:hypothetical protein
MARSASSMTLHYDLQSPAMPADEWSADLYYRMFSWMDDEYISPCDFPYSLLECTRLRHLSLRCQQSGDFADNTTWRLLDLAA